MLRHGLSATSFQTVQAGFRYFWCGPEACIAYVDTGGAWVAAGGPIAAPEARAAAVSAFLAAASSSRVRACFFAVEEPLRAASGEALRRLGIGEQPVWDPRAWTAKLGAHRSLREQLRRARAKGVCTREATPSELQAGPVHDQIARVAERWLAARSMAPMAFLVHVAPFDFTAQRRTFIAEQRGRVLGFAGLIPVPARAGWFLQDLVRDPAAPNGTGEALVDAAMRWAAESRCSWLTLGLAPLSGPLPPFLLAVRAATRLLYDFAGLRAYKAKFRPDSWQPVYLCYPSTQRQLRAIVDVLAAFASGGFLRFALRSLLRGPTVVLRALAILLVPWTLLLASAPSERWFGSGWVKWAWVCFDITVALGLFRLLAKPAARLLRTLALAVSIDAAVTTLEALAWNTRHVQGSLDWLVLALACSGPLLAAVVLWGAHRHRLLSVNRVPRR